LSVFKKETKDGKEIYSRHPAISSEEPKLLKKIVASYEPRVCRHEEDTERQSTIG
jgi:hypothetical protein